MAKQDTTQEAPANLLDQLTTILTHPEFVDHMSMLGHGMEAPPEQQLSPEKQAIIDKFLEQYHQSQNNPDLTKPIPKSPKPSAFDNFFGPVAGPAVERAGNVIKRIGFEGSPQSGFHFTFAKDKNSTNETQANPKGPSELPQKTDSTPEFSEDQSSPEDMPDQSGDYQALIDHLQEGATQLNNNINVASEASDETQKQMLNAYNKMIPIEPVTPLRVIGDLVRVGAGLAANRNPGLALALAGAGNAIKGYDPAYRDYIHRKNFANALLEGMSASSLKKLDYALQEAPQKRQLATQVGIAGLQAKAEVAKAKYHETSEDIRSRRLAETQLESQGIKTGHASLLDQVQGLVSDSGPIKKELLKVMDDSENDDLTDSEKIHMAITNHINRAYKGQAVNPSAIKKAQDELYQYLSDEVLHKKK